MAGSFTLTSHSYNGRYLQLTCTQTNNIANNTSTIKWTLSSVGGSVNYYTVGPTTVMINGTEVYYKASTSWSSQAFPAAKGSTSGTLTVNHNTDGAKSIAVSLSTAIYNGVVKTVSGTWILESNPRKATITSAPNFKETDNPKIEYSNLAGTGVSKLEAGIFSTDGLEAFATYREISRTNTEYTFSLTTAERNRFLAKLKDKSSFSVNFAIKTTIGTTSYTHTLTRTVTVSDSSLSIVPTVIDVNETTKALTGNDLVLIRYASKALAMMSVSTSNGATVKSTVIKHGAQTKTDVTNTQFDVEGDTFTFTATDSRGTNAVMNYKATIIPYIELTCNFNPKAPDTSGNMTYEVSGNYFNDSFGAVRNGISIQVRYKEEGGSYSEWFLPNSMSADKTSYTASGSITGLDYRKSYTFQARASDAIHTDGVYGVEKTLRSIPVFDWSESDFNFNVPVTINGGLTVVGDGNSDFIVEQGASGNWVYRKWNSGVAECWARIVVAATINTAWGGLYVSGSIAATNISFPFTFTAIPVVNANLSGSGSGAFLIASGSGSTSTTKTGIYELARGSASASSNNYAINYHVIGKWK
jgi:hypothetical protein